MMYDFLIVGSGFFGSVCARELTDLGYKCLVIDKRNHIGGNCYTENKDGINLHVYGAHIFHTSDEEVWKYVNKFSEFNNYRHHVLANYRGEIYSLPFNMFTFNKLWGVVSPIDAIKKIKSQSQNINEPLNLEEQSISLVGHDVYEKLIKGYTSKQWRKDPKLLPKEIIKRLPVRFNYDNNYFNDKYQGIPVNGYTEIFEKLLFGIEVRLNTDFFDNREEFEKICSKIIYTGPIDKFYDYEFGDLEYKTVEFEHFRKKTDNYQGTSVINFTDYETPYTRIIEHKHFENSKSDVTWITFEYPVEYDNQKNDPYYPVNDFENNLKFSHYKNKSKNDNKYVFGGRLADYKYYDMHQIIRRALDFVKTYKFNN